MRSSANFQGPLKFSTQMLTVGQRDQSFAVSIASTDPQAMIKNIDFTFPLGREGEPSALMTTNSFSQVRVAGFPDSWVSSRDESSSRIHLDADPAQTLPNNEMIITFAGITVNDCPGGADITVTYTDNSTSTPYSDTLTLIKSLQSSVTAPTEIICFYAATNYNLCVSSVLYEMPLSLHWKIANLPNNSSINWTLSWDESSKTVTVNADGTGEYPSDSNSLAFASVETVEEEKPEQESKFEEKPTSIHLVVGSTPNPFILTKDTTFLLTGTTNSSDNRLVCTQSLSVTVGGIKHFGIDQTTAASTVSNSNTDNDFVGSFRWQVTTAQGWALANIDLYGTDLAYQSSSSNPNLQPDDPILSLAKPSMQGAVLQGVRRCCHFFSMKFTYKNQDNSKDQYVIHSGRVPFGWYTNNGFQLTTAASAALGTLFFWPPSHIIWPDALPLYTSSFNNQYPGLPMAAHPTQPYLYQLFAQFDMINMINMNYLLVIDTQTRHFINKVPLSFDYGEYLDLAGCYWLTTDIAGKFLFISCYNPSLTPGNQHIAVVKISDDPSLKNNAPIPLSLSNLQYPPLLFANSAKGKYFYIQESTTNKLYVYDISEAKNVDKSFFNNQVQCYDPFLFGDGDIPPIYWSFSPHGETENLLYCIFIDKKNTHLRRFNVKSSEKGTGLQDFSDITRIGPLTASPGKDDQSVMFSFSAEISSSPDYITRSIFSDRDYTYFDYLSDLSVSPAWSPKPMQVPLLHHQLLLINADHDMVIVDPYDPDNKEKVSVKSFLPNSHTYVSLGCYSPVSRHVYIIANYHADPIVNGNASKIATFDPDNQVFLPPELGFDRGIRAFIPSSVARSPMSLFGRSATRSIRASSDAENKVFLHRELSVDRRAQTPILPPTTPPLSLFGRVTPPPLNLSEAKHLSDGRLDQSDSLGTETTNSPSP